MKSKDGKTYTLPAGTKCVVDGCNADANNIKSISFESGHPLTLVLPVCHGHGDAIDVKLSQGLWGWRRW